MRMRVLLLAVALPSPSLAWLHSHAGVSSAPYRRSDGSGSSSFGSSFWGGGVVANDAHDSSSSSSSSCNNLYMRKQKASDKRTSRLQRSGGGGESLLAGTAAAATTLASSVGSIGTTTRSPMQGATWKQKQLQPPLPQKLQPQPPYDTAVSIGGTSAASTATGRGGGRNSGGGGRGRSRKRATAYQILSHYQNRFLADLTKEYQAEEDVILQRIMYGDPIQLERAGHAVFDVTLDYRGRLYADYVYRLTKTSSTTTTRNSDQAAASRLLHHTFRNNDILLLTKQPHGVGDVYSARPLQDMAAAAGLLEARVLNQGPTYIDIVLTDLLPEEESDNAAVYRVDQFISPVPYRRMVNALSQLTAVQQQRSPSNSNNNTATTTTTTTGGGSGSAIRMDDVIREAIVSTYAFTEAASPLRGDPSVCQLTELSHRLSRPPMGNSEKLATQVMRYLDETAASSDHANDKFPTFNSPQRAAIEAALTRRMTLIQGPPGTGKTTVAAAIGFGFVHQCRSLSPHSKVLACAFSNVGADNLAAALIRLGLKVVRVGKPSAVAEGLWEYTLEAAIHRDPAAQKALEEAGRASARLKVATKKNGRGKSTNSVDRVLRDLTTTAVKASIRAANIAATRALRAADVIVSTSTGAADPQLLAACGITMTSDERVTLLDVAADRTLAPDGLAPLSLPFVIVDEACQSVEPATLIPIVSSNSCRALVMLGDPCQLPPTVLNRDSSDLTLSLMERLAATLPHPGVIPPMDTSLTKDDRYLDSLPIKQAMSFLRSQSSNKYERSYRKVYNGSVLLSIQYRMHPSIAALPSALFYNGLLSTPDWLAENRAFPKSFQKIMPCGGNNDMAVRLFDVGGPSNERQGVPKQLLRQGGGGAAPLSTQDQNSYWNEVEAHRVVSLVQLALMDTNNLSIGVVSPYLGQVQLIKSLLASDAIVKDLLVKRPTSIEVKSVDGYQGRERDIIIFSAVRSNRNGRIGFLHDWRRMNVALTRARKGLLIVGDFDTLSSANGPWGALYKWAKGARCVIDEKSNASNGELSH